MASLEIALVQCNPTVGALEDNADLVDARRAKAVAEGAELVLFPELVLTGYPPEDLLYQDTFLAAAWEKAVWVASRTGDELCLFGVPRRVVDGAYADGRTQGVTVANSAVAARGGRIVAIYDKIALPNYGVFDERRWFISGGAEPPLIEHRGVHIVPLICEDAWIDPSPGEPGTSLVGDQAISLPRHDASRGLHAGSPRPDLVCVLNASPYRVGKIARRTEVMARLAGRFGCPVAAVNMVGGQDELVFDGSSMLISGDATPEFVAPAFTDLIVRAGFASPAAERMKGSPDIAGDAWVRPTTLVLKGEEVDLLGPISVPSRPQDASLARSEEGADSLGGLSGPEGEIYTALTIATRDYILKSGFTSAWVALSGGIDSALTAAIAVDALGADKVRGVMMPSRYSSDHSVTDAKTLADNLGIQADLISIDGTHSAMEDALDGVWLSGGAGLAGENVQARLRGVIIMALSNSHGGLVLTTGNKSETAVGYCTLYGDMAGAYAVLKDVLKTEVYRLCRWRNSVAGIDLIPEHVLTKPPSAELRPDQTDQDSLPPYEVLDAIISGYLDDDAGPERIAARTGHDLAVVRRVLGMIDRAEFKRRQGAPGVKISGRAFGRDRRMPIVNRWRH